jgi:hypothetical protein
MRQMANYVNDFQGDSKSMGLSPSSGEGELVVMVIVWSFTYASTLCSTCHHSGRRIPSRTIEEGTHRKADKSGACRDVQGRENG